VIKGWINKKHKEYWQFISGQKQANGFVKRPSAEKAGELLSLSRNQPQIMIGLLTGHYHLQVDLYKLGLASSPKCDICKQALEMASHTHFVAVRLWPY
jgi:hypothetical protein